MHDVEREILDSFFPSFLSILLSKELLDTDRLNDKEYINQVVKENKHQIIDEMRLHIIDDYTFIAGMKSEISHSRSKTAIVLGATNIEHIMNHFYQSALPLVFNLEQEEINKAIVRLNLPDKVGWFYKIVTKTSLPEGLISNIREINSTRNNIVHFQAIPEMKNSDKGSYGKIAKSLKNFDVSTIITTINELKIELEKITCDLQPEIKLANEIFERLYK